MSFEHPLVLLLLPLMLAPLWPERAGGAPARVPFPAAAFARNVGPSWRRRFASFRRGLRALVVGLVVIALAGPRTGMASARVTADGIDILLVLDTSVSMTTDLGDKSRLEVAKDVIDEFIEGRPQDRIGLITFAKFPRVVCPLTLDHRALRGFLGQIHPVTDQEERSTTAIGVALGAAVIRLKDQVERTRIVVLLTDGEEGDKSVEPIEAAAYARAHGVRVYAIAVAKWAGRWARELERVGRETGGDGYAATDAAALAQAYRRIDALERREVDEERVVEWTPLHAWALGIALALFLLERPARQLVLRRVP